MSNNHPTVHPDGDMCNTAPSSSEQASPACSVREPRDSRGTGRATLIARSAREPDTQPAFVLGQPNQNGYRFGPGRFSLGPRLAETNLPRIVAGVSSMTAGFEVLDAAGVVLAWRDCIVKACSFLRTWGGEGKVVRCPDRALMMTRRPVKGRP